MKKSKKLFLLLTQALGLICFLSCAPSVLNAQVKAWGNNQYGQLGNGTTDSQPLPVLVNGLNDIIDISSGPETTYAVRRNGTVLSWGNNRYGLLGTGSTTPDKSTVPVPVINLTNVISVKAGTRACLALKADGTVWVWGNNYLGQFGNGEQGGQLASNPTPQQITGLPNIVAISVNTADHVLALDSQGRVWGWGENTRSEINFKGGLYVLIPQLVHGFPAGTVVTKISAAIFNSAALTANGEVYVWGDNRVGQDGLGRCNIDEVFGQPTRIVNGGVSQIAASIYGVAALQTNGNVLYWGKNDYAQAGNNTFGICTALVNTTISNVTDIRSGGIHFLARKTDGTIWGWGYNIDCQIGAGNCGVNERLPVQTQAGAGNSRIFEAGGRNGFLSNPKPSSIPFDFDGDSKTDISIFRPSNGQWWYYRSSDGGNYAATFGNSSDKLVPGDFTGDGRADIAIFRPVSGEWFILRSEDGSYYSYPFGTTGDIPAVGDFDADGKADSAVFRPSDTNWYIRRSSDGGFIIQQFGASGDIPAVADYDGDGKSDIAIWRTSVGQWWIQRSSNSSVIAFTFGNSSDKPVQGDYTGDSKADVAIWRPSSGEWFILRSEDFSYYSFPFGTNGDIPAPGDYDGDGHFDATVFRPAGSTWFVQRSTAGTLIQGFGQSGDKPVPNAFVP